MHDPVRLTTLSRGAGCGCKIAPAQLEAILRSTGPAPNDPRLLVGYGTRDDAAVYDLGDGRCLISTTDFFTPIVDDPFDFGRIAGTNAISDVYAMGGRPLMAVAILGWPIEQLGTERAQQVVEGGRRACLDAGIMLAGGHSIDAVEPFFGLAVTGEVPKANIKRNDTAQAGDILFLTKPLGLGILSTALKRGKLRPEDGSIAAEIMVRSNRIGTTLGTLAAVHALTDVTGFGLLGHLLEICRGSNVDATLHYNAVPRIPEALSYLAEGHYPDGSLRNWKSHANDVLGAGTMERMLLLSDPQTSGGLLVACAADAGRTVQGLLEAEGIPAAPIGHLSVPAGGPRITVA